MDHGEVASARALNTEDILVIVLEFFVKEPDINVFGVPRVLATLLGSVPDTRLLFPCSLVSKLWFAVASKLIWRFDPPVTAFQTVDRLTQAGIYLLALSNLYGTVTADYRMSR